MKKEDFPTHIKAPAELWNALRKAENHARAALRVGNFYTEGRTQIDCETALSTSVNVVASHWLDVSAEPMVPWVKLTEKVYTTAALRNSLQESLKEVLELDGVIARIFGAKYRRRLKIRLLKRMIAKSTPPTLKN